MAQTIESKSDITLILDFHGTMTDHQLRLIRAYREAGRALGIKPNVKLYQAALTRPSHSKNGEGNGETHKQFLLSRFKNQFSSEQIALAIAAHSRAMKATYIPVPGIKPTIAALTTMGVEVVLLTNGNKPPLIRDILTSWDPTGRFGVRALVDKFYSALELGGESWKKPDTRSLDVILADLRSSGKVVNKDRMLVVGDAKVDIQMAEKYGVDSVLLVRGTGQETFKLVKPRPTHVITDPKELLQIVANKRPRETRKNITISPLLWKSQDWGFTPTQQ